jgi:acyl dehydratase
VAIHYDTLKSFIFEDQQQSYSRRDAILYALGIGLGLDPLDRQQLKFVYERDLVAMPTMGVVLAQARNWLMRPELGITWQRVLHGEHGLVLHRPMPAKASLRGTTRIEEVVDKGADKGALVYVRRTVFEQGIDAPLLTVRQTLLCRADGGFGGPVTEAAPVFRLPPTAPALAVDLPTSPQAALIYRLSGDANPLHIDPDMARQAGFDRPILHGLCTFGIAGHALLRGVFDYAPEKMHTLQGRFSAPVYPGDTIRTEIWQLGEGAFAFRCKAVERDVVVLDNGKATARQGTVGA